MNPKLTKKGKKLLLKKKLEIEKYGSEFLVSFDSVVIKRTGRNTFVAYLCYKNKKIFKWDYLPSIDIGDILHLSGIYKSTIKLRLI